MTSYSGSQIKVIGKVNLTCFHGKSKVTPSIYVIDTSAPALLALRSCLDLGLVELTYSVNKAPPSPLEPLDKASVLLSHGKLQKELEKILGPTKM